MEHLIIVNVYYSKRFICAMSCSSTSQVSIMDLTIAQAPIWPYMWLGGGAFASELQGSWVRVPLKPEFCFRFNRDCNSFVCCMTAMISLVFGSFYRSSFDFIPIWRVKSVISVYYNHCQRSVR